MTAGNTSAFGLIDWDNKNCAEARIDVLSPNLRNGLENAIYDPLALVYLIVRDLPLELPVLGLASKTTTNDLDLMDDKEIQALVDRLQDHILGPQSDRTISDIVTYRGGRRLAVRRDYLQKDDHGLGTLIKEKLPNIHKIQSKNSGATPLYIVDRLFQEKPHIIAQDLLDTLARLLDAPSHVA